MPCTRNARRRIAQAVYWSPSCPDASNSIEITQRVRRQQARLRRAKCQQARLRRAKCQQARLRRAKCRHAFRKRRAKSTSQARMHHKIRIQRLVLSQSGELGMCRLPYGEKFSCAMVANARSLTALGDAASSVTISSLIIARRLPLAAPKRLRICDFDVGRIIASKQRSYSVKNGSRAPSHTPNEGKLASICPHSRNEGAQLSGDSACLPAPRVPHAQSVGPIQS